MITDGEMTTAYERSIANSSVQGGQRYQVNALGGASKDLNGKTVKIQYLLFRVDDNDVEVCVESDIEVA